MEKMLGEKIVSKLIEIIDKERTDQGITNDIIRDDVFYLLDHHCIIIYYPFPKEDINGYHISRHITGEKEDFVFINTANTTEKQIFAAAHELGHILKVDEIIYNCFDIGVDVETSEAIVNRFAAELLMPKEIFTEKIKGFLNKYNNGSDNLLPTKMLELIVYLMNEFLVEYEAIIKRFLEVNELSEEDANLLRRLTDSEAFDQHIKKIAKTSNYTRLFIRSNYKSMSELVESLDEARKHKTLTEEKIARLAEEFDIKLENMSDDDSPLTYKLKTSD